MIQASEYRTKSNQFWTKSKNKRNRFLIIDETIIKLYHYSIRLAHKPQLNTYIDRYYSEVRIAKFLRTSTYKSTYPMIIRLLWMLISSDLQSNEIFFHNARPSFWWKILNPFREKVERSNFFLWKSIPKINTLNQEMPKSLHSSLYLLVSRFFGDIQRHTIQEQKYLEKFILRHSPFIEVFKHIKDQKIIKRYRKTTSRQSDVDWPI